MSELTRRLPAEWEEQDGVLIAWPHADTDWAEVLEMVDGVYTEIVREIAMREAALIITPEPDRIRAILKKNGIAMKNTIIAELPTNDTWTRDYGPITIVENGKLKVLDFTFNAWGLKFASNEDNLATRRLAAAQVFKGLKVKTLNFVLEGGGVESDGQGTLLVTAECLLNPNRNPQFGMNRIEKKLKKYLGADHVMWLESGWLAGDDTDSHIDTLARLCPGNTITYVSPPAKGDEHFEELSRMERELKALRTRDGQAYRLLGLPFARPAYDEDSNRLPATYANFLVINGAVLVPTYQDPERDAEALKVIGQAFPGREIVGINCLPLVLQHGSLHCVTMQLPLGVLNPELKRG